jgi:hypothetical protein
LVKAADINELNNFQMIILEYLPHVIKVYSSLLGLVIEFEVTLLLPYVVGVTEWALEAQDKLRQLESTGREEVMVLRQSLFKAVAKLSFYSRQSLIGA